MGEKMIENYENITYKVTGMSTINDAEGTKQEGLLIHLQRWGFDNIDIFLDKRDCAHIAKTTQEARKFWKPFKLPKMVEQTSKYCLKCGKYTSHNKIAGKWKCIRH